RANRRRVARAVEDRSMKSQERVVVSLTAGEFIIGRAAYERVRISRSVPPARRLPKEGVIMSFSALTAGGKSEERVEKTGRIRASRPGSKQRVFLPRRVKAARAASEKGIKIPFTRVRHRSIGSAGADSNKHVAVGSYIRPTADG